jgi:SAM-dependent methyltransferase
LVLSRLGPATHSTSGSIEISEKYVKTCIECHEHFVSDSWVCPRCGSSPADQSGVVSFLAHNLEGHNSFDSKYFPELFLLERGNFWFDYRNRLILQALETHFPCMGNVLEIGCGTGFVLSEIHRKYPALRLSGSDLYLEGLSFARERVPDAAFYQMDACCMPFEGEFDLILALDILEHIADDFKAFCEIHRSLRPGGGVVITVPQHGWMWSRQDASAFHQRRYSRQELQHKLREAGFQVVHITSFITLLLPVMIFSRLYALLNLNRHKVFDPLRELRISPVLSRILGLVCSAEERIIKAGISLPMGGSLLCIGRKGQ